MKKSVERKKPAAKTKEERKKKQRSLCRKPPSPLVKSSRPPERDDISRITTALLNTMAIALSLSIQYFLTREEIGTHQKPYVAIIKDITQAKDGSMMVTGQWFYRPEEVEKKGGGSWEHRDTRELFYSFHHDEVPAESVMHKCVMHFVPLNKQLPLRSEHPGFIVLKVYDTVERKLRKLTDKYYEDTKQHKIDLLVQ